jgi:hypothetical protein
LAKYQRAIIIGVLSAGLVMTGMSYVNQQTHFTNGETSLLNKEVEPTKLHEWDKCNPNQIIVGGGFCQDCPEFSRPDVQKVKCIKDRCNTNNREALLADGTCMECFPYS